MCVKILCRVLNGRHTAKTGFAVCTGSGHTRQIQSTWQRADSGLIQKSRASHSLSAHTRHLLTARCPPARRVTLLAAPTTAPRASPTSPKRRPHRALRRLPEAPLPAARPPVPSSAPPPRQAGRRAASLRPPPPRRRPELWPWLGPTSGTEPARAPALRRPSRG